MCQQHEEQTIPFAIVALACALRLHEPRLTPLGPFHVSLLFIYIYIYIYVYIYIYICFGSPMFVYEPHAPRTQSCITSRKPHAPGHAHDTRTDVAIGKITRRTVCLTMPKHHAYIYHVHHDVHPLLANCDMPLQFDQNKHLNQRDNNNTPTRRTNATTHEKSMAT